MGKLRFLTIAEQVEEHLRGELERGRWSGQMPGKHELAGELGVNNKTVETALKRLETKGLIASQGAGRRRSILRAEDAPQRKMLRIAMMAGEPSDFTLDYIIELRHRLQAAGHAVQIAPRTMLELRDDIERLARLVRSMEADAWVVVGGSRTVLEWFAEKPEPVFALFGRRDGLPLAATGPDKASATVAATRELIRLGHRRIVLIVRPRRRLPHPGEAEKAFLTELETHGLAVGGYNLPNWDETPQDYHQCLDQLFRMTPPTAMIIDEVEFFFATMQFLLRRGLRVPDDVSLVATDPDPTFHWCQPRIAHITWDSEPVVRRIMRWASNVSRGLDDRRQTLTKAEFVVGGSIGPAKNA
jgi:DNA-binding LacI/PurR family transcriptional regulator